MTPAGPHGPDGEQEVSGRYLAATSELTARSLAATEDSAFFSPAANSVIKGPRSAGRVGGSIGEIRMLGRGGLLFIGPAAAYHSQADTYHFRTETYLSRTEAYNHTLYTTHHHLSTSIIITPSSLIIHHPSSSIIRHHQSSDITHHHTSSPIIIHHPSSYITHHHPSSSSINLNRTSSSIRDNGPEYEDLIRYGDWLGGSRLGRASRCEGSMGGLGRGAFDAGIGGGWGGRGFSMRGSRVPLESPAITGNCHGARG